MAQEIERKFLVKDRSYRDLAFKSHHIAQGYLSTNPDVTVRLRIMDDSAFLTIKGRCCGIVRNEWEYPVPCADAADMLGMLCGNHVIDKIRYFVKFHGLVWEIDEFYGSLSGLVVAEIELPSESYSLDEYPSFVGNEVSGDVRYYNSSLINDGMPDDVLPLI